MNFFEAFGETVRTPGAVVTAIVAVIYGTGIAFLGNSLGESGRHWWTMVGALICGVLFIAFIVIPTIQRMGS